MPSWVPITLKGKFLHCDLEHGSEKPLPFGDILGLDSARITARVGQGLGSARITALLFPWLHSYANSSLPPFEGFSIPTSDELWAFPIQN